MPRTVHIFVGDRVETVHGIGIVEEVYTWRDRIIEMTDPQAAEFCDQCMRNVGLNYKETWAEVQVSVNGRLRTYLAPNVKVLEGRDAKDGQKKY